MTPDDYTTLMEFLATRFARIDASLAGLDARMGRLEAGQEALEVRMDRLEERVGALEERMGAVEARLDAIEVRLTALERRQEAVELRQNGLEARLARAEVLWESMRDDLRRVAEGLVALSERVDRRLDGIQVQFDRFAVDFGTVQLDHGTRIEVLERWRSVRDSRSTP